MRVGRFFQQIGRPGQIVLVFLAVGNRHQLPFESSPVLPANHGKKALGLLLLLRGQGRNPALELFPGHVLGIKVRPLKLFRGDAGEKRLEIVQVRTRAPC